MTSHNELGTAVSPYLLQHKDNPVHWRAWGPEALAEAKRDGKPILLSIGYAACHWCHVMAHESFEDEATAAVMNELFINIKVDREERPDVDHLYMSALHALGQQGGWPLTMFLSSDAEPFWGGTYFPKASQYGRPAFVDMLRQIATIYHTNPETVRRNTRALAEALAARPAAGEGQLGQAMFEVLGNAIAQRIDIEHGGLSGAPKFPNVPLLLLLWRCGARMRRKDIQGLVLMTLQRICDGGIYDHLGGGFARYSVDAKWLVPHFEKMLYDNAQLLELLALAYQETRHPLFRARAQETVGWLEREMTTADGAFCASLDADSDGVEGKFYVWTAAEIAATLGAEDAAFFARFYDVTPNGNWRDEHTGQSVTVLNRSQSPEASEADEARLGALREKLLGVRAGRVRPGLDDKVLADWNGLMIVALVNAAAAFARPAWIGLARQAFEFVATAMARDDRLAHAARAGRLTYPGMALDHAAMIAAGLALHEATGDAGFLRRCEVWAGSLARHHGDPETGLLFMSADDSRDLFSRQAPTSDEAVPNAHGVFAACLVKLAGVTGDETWRRRADDLFAALGPAAAANPLSHASILNAFDYRLRAATIVVAGRDRQALREAALATPFLNRSVIDVGDIGNLPPDHPVLAQAAQAGDGAAFICVGERCSLPIRDPAGIAARLEDMAA